jgi:hypothetical protein
MWKNIAEPDRPQIKMLYGACALFPVKLRLQTDTQNIKYLGLIFFHGNNGYAKASRTFLL